MVLIYCLSPCHDGVISKNEIVEAMLHKMLVNGRLEKTRIPDFMNGKKNDLDLALPAISSLLVDVPDEKLKVQFIEFLKLIKNDEKIPNYPDPNL